MIHLLDIHIANLIAAGEVVDRPSSALKELIENAVDAGATIVTIEIKNGGIAYIRVTDNGVGMDGEDLGRAVLRHATSKIKDESDLEKITTLGFRGEALAAVSSVSDLKIFTKVKDAPTGYMLSSSSGQNTKISEAGCAAGTTVVVERLFSKIPARQKFLKRDITEGMYCKWITEKTALSNPGVSFRFIADEKQKIFTPGNGSYRDAVYAVFGDEIADKLITVGELNNEFYDESNIKVYGYISRIENGQKTRVNENFFVNGRYVYSKTIMAALEEAYKSVSETRTFPVCALYIKVDESQVDINVHPQKMEIKFSDEKKVYSAVYYAVKDALGEAGTTNAAPVFTEPEKIPLFGGVARGTSDGVVGANAALSAEPNYKSKYFDNTATIENIEYTKPEIAPIAPVQEVFIEEPNYKILGEAFYGYIFVEKGEKIIVIDKHAAHERIIYDIILKKAADESAASEFISQIMLVPALVKLTPKEAAGISYIEKDMVKLGIVFNWRDDETLEVTEVPPEIYGADVGELIKEAAALGADENLPEGKTAFEALAALSAKKARACKTAMKSGVGDRPGNIAWLADRVINHGDARYCPHGRPVLFEITKNDIEKQFKR